MPNEVPRGGFYLCTRKVAEDWLLLRPEPDTVNLMGYMAVFWGEHYFIKLLALILLSNHYHLVCEDLRGLYPDWLCMVNHWVSRIMNDRLDHTQQAFWGPSPRHPVRLLEPAAITDKLNYVVTNAVRHGLTARAYDWPGLVFGPEQAGQKITFTRPPELDGSDIFPPTVTFEVPVPPAAAVPSDGFAALRQATEATEAERRNGHFMGVERAMTQPRWSRPRKVKRSKLNPRYATKDKAVLAAAIRARKKFLIDYEETLERFRNGDRDIPWPKNTFKMRRRYNLPPP